MVATRSAIVALIRVRVRVRVGVRVTVTVTVTVRVRVSGHEVGDGRLEHVPRGACVQVDGDDLRDAAGEQVRGLVRVRVRVRLGLGLSQGWV